MQRPFEFKSETGALGHPELGTAEKGKALLQAGVDQVVAFVREIAVWPPIEPR